MLSVAMPKPQNPQPQNPEKFKPEVEQSGLAMKILSHWTEFRPKMCKELKTKGRLYQSVLAAARMTASLLVELRQEGIPYDQASEVALREWYLLPSEKDQPSLTFDPGTLPLMSEQDRVDPATLRLLPSPRTSA